MTLAAADTTGAAVSIKGTAVYVLVKTDAGWRIATAAEMFPRPEET